MFSAPLYQFLQGMITSKYQHFDGFESVPILKWANFNRILTQDIFLKQRVCHMLVLLKLVHCYRNCCMLTWEGCGDFFSFPWCSSKVVFVLSYLLCLLVLLFFFAFCCLFFSFGFFGYINAFVIYCVWFLSGFFWLWAFFLLCFVLSVGRSVLKIFILLMVDPMFHNFAFNF